MMPMGISSPFSFSLASSLGPLFPSPPLIWPAIDGRGRFTARLGRGGHAVLLISLSRLGGKSYSSSQTSPTAQPGLAGEGETGGKLICCHQNSVKLHKMMHQPIMMTFGLVSYHQRAIKKDLPHSLTLLKKHFFSLCIHTGNISGSSFKQIQPVFGTSVCFVSLVSSSFSPGDLSSSKAYLPSLIKTRCSI